MISPKFFFDSLKELKINFFAGVPDSLLKNFCAYLFDNTSEKEHIICANEGNAIALAAGNYLATGNPSLVYMQNSGEGNAINPLVSLIDKEVYNIPVLLLIGWRGEPGKYDEPQHKKQGRITLSLLDALEIRYEIISENESEVVKLLDKAKKYMEETHEPFALIAKSDLFEKYELKKTIENNFKLTREQAIMMIIDSLGDEDIIVSTTGKASRELFEYREFLKQGHEKDFLTVGSMGHSSSIALGIALSKQDKNIYCLDGDGAAIMHMGSLAIIGEKSPSNLKHILLNNGCHESVGGQPTTGFDIDFNKIAKACGYNVVLSAETKEELIGCLKNIKCQEQLCFLEIKLNDKSRSNLGRPTITPIENKKDFMNFLNK
ncbi:MAG: phosphonopyruvate decarboxylase [Candidatus Nanoarchaeia archaeon]|nr:phosphonopyruvate decarboxylase [Candidatus Nanoarchaeia archaeon]